MFHGAEPTVSARLREQGSARWWAAVSHPMVLEIVAGTLPRERFRGYFEQNIAYLEDYARSLAYVAAAAPDVDALEIVTELLGQIVTVELPANRHFLQRLGGDPRTAGGVMTMQPTTYAYTRHLLTASALADCAVGLAAVLPCQWTYGEIGAAIAGSAAEDAIFDDWLRLFADDGYGELLERATGLLDRLGSGASNSRLAEMSAVFDASIQYEVEFWEMAYKGVPVQS